MPPLFIFLSVITCLISASHGCMEPVPDYLTQIDETDGSGTVVVTMYDPPSSSPSSWTIRITSPPRHATYLETFLHVTHNSTTSPQWKVVLKKPLDIEQIQRDKGFILSDLTLDLQCSSANTHSVLHYERTVVIRAVSEFKPLIATPLPRFNVTEASSVDTIVASLADHVTDEDVQNNGQSSDIKQFTAHAYNDDDLARGDSVFGVTTAGDIVLMKTLDYEQGELPYGLNITVEDTGGLTSWFIVTIDVINANDNTPVFALKSARGKLQPVTEYKATVEDYYTGPITLEPGPIEAFDADNDVISYYIKTGHPDDFSSYISLDEFKGTVSLTRPVNSSRISHFTLIIEARDGPHSRRSGEISSDVHTASTSLLVFVSGRNVDFPGTPRSGSSSTIASVNSDALLIGVIVLSTLSFILLVAVVVLCCRIKRNKRRQKENKFPGFDDSRCNTLQGRKPNDWSIQMRPVERVDSEKAFMRSLSRNPTPYVNEAYVNNDKSNSSSNSNDDVFVTGITPYTNVHSSDTKQRSRSVTMNSDQDVISRGIMPYNDQTEEAIDSILAARHSASTLPRSAPLNSPAAVSFTTTTTDFASSSSSNHQTPAANTSHSFESLDLHTSVKPFAEDNNNTRPIHIIQKDNDLNNASTIMNNNGTLRSLNSADYVMNELDQIIFNENQQCSERGEKVTHFTNESTTDYNTLTRREGEEHKTRPSEEGITSFSRDSIEFGVTPFDPTSSMGSVETFHFPGEQNSRPKESPGNPFRNDPVLNSADVYYRQNSEST